MKPRCPTTPHKRLASLWDRVSKTPKSSHSKSYTVVETYHKRPPSCVSDPNHFDLFSGGKIFQTKSTVTVTTSYPGYHRYFLASDGKHRSQPTADTFSVKVYPASQALGRARKNQVARETRERRMIGWLVLSLTQVYDKKNANGND